jgi:hypothetical protein
MSPPIVQGLIVNVGVAPQPGQNPVVVAQNSDAQFLLSFFDENNYPYDVTGASAIEFSVLEADDLTVLSKTLVSGITLVSGYRNQVLVSMVAADFALLANGNNDCQVNLEINGSNYNFNLFASLNVQPSVI